MDRTHAHQTVAYALKQAAEMEAFLIDSGGKKIENGYGLVEWHFRDDSVAVCDQSGSHEAQWFVASEQPWDITDAAGEAHLVATKGTRWTVPLGLSPNERRVFRLIEKAQAFIQQQRKEYLGWTGELVQYIDGQRQVTPRGLIPR